MELDRYFEGILDKSKIPAIISRAKEDKDMAAIDLIKSYNADRRLVPQNYRLEFSVNYKLLITKSPLDIAKAFIGDKSNLEVIRLFNSRQHLIRQEVYSGSIVRKGQCELSNAYVQSFNSHKFIGSYDLEEEFNKRNQITYRVQGKNGEIYTLTKELAQKLIQTLEENDLPQTEHIVKAYFRSIANETSEEFLNHLTTHTKTLKKVL